MSPTASDTSASAGLSVRGLAVTYGDLCAVDGVDLEVAAGEVVALLGASGSGKSSLLRAVAGLEDVAAGEVAWDGRSMVRVPVHKRGFGLMFQDGQLFEHRDVGSNIAYGLTGLPRVQRSERVREMLELVGLPGFERRRVTTLSGSHLQVDAVDGTQVPIGHGEPAHGQARRSTGVPGSRAHGPRDRATLLFSPVAPALPPRPGPSRVWSHSQPSMTAALPTARTTPPASAIPWFWEPGLPMSR